MTAPLHFEAAEPATPATAAALAYQTYASRPRFGSLDGLRCLCIAAVLWHHAPWWTSMADRPLILGRGFVGVDFFFVLSGFLITTLLLREERARGRFSLAAFYWRRALRILPVYLFVVTTVGLYYLVMPGKSQYLYLLPYYYLFLSNFLVDHIAMLFPTWSLAVEEQYYLMWPVALMLLPRRVILPALAFVVTVNVLISMGVFGLTAPRLGPLLFSLPNATYAPMLIGSALAILLDRPAVFRALWPVLGSPLAAPLAFLGIGLLLQFLPPDLRGPPNLVLHLAMALTIAALSVREDHPLAPLMRWRPIARAGEICYGIYIYHLIALHFATIGLAAAGVTSGPAILIGYSALSFAMAEASDRTLERFFRGFRNRGPGAPRPAAAPDPA